LINVGAKSRALLHFRIKTQSTATGSLRADWLREWHLQTPGHNPPQIQRIPASIEYLRQFALDGARNRRMKRAKHINVVYTTPWLHSYERRLNSQSCGSHVSGLTQTGRLYGAVYMGHRYMKT